MIIRGLQVLSVRQEVRNYNVTYRQRLTGHPNSLAKSLLQRPNYNRRLKRYYPADVATRFNWYSAKTIPNHLWLRLNRRCITGCIAYMPLIVTVNTIAECLQTDCNILGDNKKLLNSFNFFWEIKKLLNSFRVFWEIIKNYFILFIFWEIIKIT